MPLLVLSLILKRIERAPLLVRPIAKAISARVGTAHHAAAGRRQPVLARIGDGDVQRAVAVEITRRHRRAEAALRADRGRDEHLHARWIRAAHAIPVAG